jgi:formylglycine-generating enzyme required for sulfatase activity
MGAQKTDPQGHNHDPNSDDDESPVHLVHLDGYRIGRYPVTVDQYRLFVENGGYELEPLWEAGGFGQFPAPDRWEQQLEHPNWPVTGVSWYEAQAFCRWTKCRLPTEAQWERAARAGDDRRYPWGNDEPDPARMNYATKTKDAWKPNVGHPTPVGVYPRGSSPEGIADMAGNVLEWCQDGKREYSSGDVRNPVGPTQSEVGRVVRGGSWSYDPRACRVSFRYAHHPSSRYQYVGFRLVCVLFGQD